MRRALETLAACFALVAGLLLASPLAARACAVCMSGTEDETRLAFILTTGLLTFLPLSMVGSCVWWLRRRARALAEDADAEPRPVPVISRASSSP